MRWATWQKKANKPMLRTCLRIYWNGWGKEVASLGQRHTCLAKLNTAIKGLTIKAIYLIRKQFGFFFSTTHWATFIQNTELLPRVASPGDTFDRHQIHGKKNMVFSVPQVPHSINLEGSALSLWCLMLAFIPTDRWLKSQWVLKQRSWWGLFFTCKHRLRHLSVQLKHWM